MTTDGSESNQQSTNDAKVRGRGARGRRHDEGQRMHTTIKQIMRRGAMATTTTTTMTTTMTMADAVGRMATTG